MIVFNKYTGDIISQIPDEQDVFIFYKDYPDDFKEKISFMLFDEEIKNLYQYKVIDNKIIQRSEKEVQEFLRYGKVLTEEERLIEQLKPTLEEIEEAKLTIKILTQLQEVM